MVARAKEKANPRHKVHQKYYVNGTQVPGVTTVLGVLNKPALMHWAWNLGIQGIDYKKFRDDKADIGTLGHYLVACDLKGEKPDQEYLDTFTRVQIDAAENSFLSYLEWRKQHHFELILSEAEMVSEIYLFGGTLDIIGKLDGRKGLIDIKTGKAIYDNYYFQVAAYRQMALENGFGPLDFCAILNIPRAEDEKFAFREESNARMDLAFEVFLGAKSVYDGLKNLDWRL